MAMRKLKTSNSGETSLRRVWLAGLGLMAVVAHDALSVAGRAVGGVAGARQQARGTVEHALSRLLTMAQGARRGGHFDDGIGARFVPALRKQALRPQAMSGAGRKPATKKRGHHAVPWQSVRTDRKD